MDREQAKKVIDKAVGASVVLDATLEPGEYYVYTDMWSLSIQQFDEIRQSINVTNISAEGNKITLTIQL